MAGGFMVPKTGAQGIAQKFSDIERQQAATRGANDFESAVIGADGITVKDGGAIRLLDGNGIVSTLLELGFLFQGDPLSGAAVQLSNGQILMWGDLYGNPDNYGRLMTDPGDVNVTRWFPPFSDGTGNENSITIQGRRPGQSGNLWAYSDGSMTLRVQDDAGTKIGSLNLAADVINLEANQLRPYGLDFTGGGTPLVMEVVGGAPVIKLSSSALKLKQDVETYDVDPELALQIRSVLFRDRSAVQEKGDDAPFIVGVIADELDELGLTYFVDYDEDGEVRGARYDRIWIALLSLAKHEHAERLALQERVDEQDTLIATLTARLDALEAQ